MAACLVPPSFKNSRICSHIYNALKSKLGVSSGFSAGQAAGGSGVRVITPAGSNVGVLEGTRVCVAVGRSVRVSVGAGVSEGAGTGEPVAVGQDVLVTLGGRGVRDGDGGTVRLGGWAVAVSVGAGGGVEVIAGAAVGLAWHAANKIPVQISPTSRFMCL
jgi:hypothetical protein